MELLIACVMVGHVLRLSAHHKSPTDPDVKLPYLQLSDNELRLNKKHKYYTQCQQQMAITGTEKCYFFIYFSWLFFRRSFIRSWTLGLHEKFIY